MVGSWALGFVGIIMIVGGIPGMIVGLLPGLIGEKWTLFLFSFGVTAAGSFFKYYSSQTVRVAGMGADQRPGQQHGTDRLKIFPEDQRTTENDGFKLFLVDHFGIRKHETIGKFVLGEALFDTLEQACERAKQNYVSLLNTAEETNSRMAQDTKFEWGTETRAFMFIVLISLWILCIVLWTI